MRSLASSLASILVALGLGAGLLALELTGPAQGASLGAAVAVAAIAAFLLTYDILKRDELGGQRETPAKAAGGGKAPVKPKFDVEDAVYIDAAPRSGIAHMNEVLKDQRKDVVYIFRIRLKPRNRYEHQALNEQLAVLVQQIDRETFVYFVNPDDSFVCLTYAETLLSLLKDAKGAGLVELVNNGLDEVIKETFEKELTVFTLSRKSSSADALGLMALKNKPLAMIVHETRRTPIGPIDWATLATRVLRKKA